MYIMHIIDICLSIAYFLGWLPNGDDATQHDELRHATGAPGGSCSKAVVIALVFCWIWDQDFQAYPAWWTHTYTYMKCVYIYVYFYICIYIYTYIYIHMYDNISTGQLHPGSQNSAYVSKSRWDHDSDLLQKLDGYLLHCLALRSYPISRSSV